MCENKIVRNTDGKSLGGAAPGEYFVYNHWCCWSGTALNCSCCQIRVSHGGSRPVLGSSYGAAIYTIRTHLNRTSTGEPAGVYAGSSRSATSRLVALGLQPLLFSMRLRSLRQALRLCPRQLSWRRSCATCPRPCAGESRGKSTPQCCYMPV